MNKREREELIKICNDFNMIIRVDNPCDIKGLVDFHKKSLEVIDDAKSRIHELIGISLFGKRE